MKKTVSFNLEEDIIQRIEDYKKDNNLSSRSSALERMILLQNSALDINLIKSLIRDLVSEVNSNETVNKPVVEEKISILSSSISNAFDNIGD